MKSNERLTERSPRRVPISKRNICSNSPWYCHDFDCKDCPIGEILNRLCEYEDTGLTPEEIMVPCGGIDMTLDEAIEHCREKENCSACGQEHKQLRLWLEELKERRRDMRPENLRACKVDKLGNAFFHEWIKISKIIEPSPLVGGHPGGVISNTLGIVELLDGTVATVDPRSIKFTDIKNMNDCQNSKEAPYITRDFLNKTITYLAEHKAFSLENDQFELHLDRIPEDQMKRRCDRTDLIKNIKKVFEISNEALKFVSGHLIEYQGTKEQVARALKYAKEVTSQTHQCQ